MLPSRRRFLAQGSVAAASFLPSISVLAQAVKTPQAETAAGGNTLLKFSADGTPQPFAGNTVICHLPAQCAMRDVMSDFHNAMKASAFRGRLGLTPVDSYHMTIFPGANDLQRTASGWPSYVPMDATIEECDAAVGARMQQLRLKCDLPLRVKVDELATLHYPLACTLRMKAADDAEEAKLRSVRDQISAAYGFRLPDHAIYQFHITLSYQVSPFSPVQQGQFTAMRAEYVKRIVAAQPVLELTNPEFCVFPDMLRFEPKVLLKCVAKSASDAGRVNAFATPKP